MGRHLYCGDNRIDMPYETCDDGNRTPGDGCDKHCKSEEDDAGVADAGGPTSAPSGVAGTGSLVPGRPITTTAGAAAVSTLPDGGAAPELKHDDDDGCGCRLQARTERPPVFVALALAALMWARRRKRRRE
jgi:cysteine-rich repeat protein